MVQIYGGSLQSSLDDNVFMPGELMREWSLSGTFSLLESISSLGKKSIVEQFKLAVVLMTCSQCVKK